MINFDETEDGLNQEESTIHDQLLPIDQGHRDSSDSLSLSDNQPSQFDKNDISEIKQSSHSISVDDYDELELQTVPILSTENIDQDTTHKHIKTPLLNIEDIDKKEIENTFTTPQISPSNTQIIVTPPISITTTPTKSPLHSNQVHFLQSSTASERSVVSETGSYHPPPPLKRNKSQLEITQGYYSDGVLEISIEGAPRHTIHHDDPSHVLFSHPFHQEEIQVSEKEYDYDNYFDESDLDHQHPPNLGNAILLADKPHQLQEASDSSEDDNEQCKRAIVLTKAHHNIKHKKINAPHPQRNPFEKTAQPHPKKKRQRQYQHQQQQPRRENSNRILDNFIDEDGYSMNDIKSFNCCTPYYHLLAKNGNYLLYWLSAMISLMGDWFNELACLTLLTRYEVSGIMISVFLVLRESPPFLLQALTGVVSDSFDRRFIMITADIVRAIVVLLFLLIQSQSKIWLLYLIAFIQFSVGSFFQPAKSALLPSLVPQEDIITANAVDQSTYSTMMLIGASLGGVISYSLGTNVNFIIDCFTYILSAVFVFSLYLRTKSILEINPRYKQHQPIPLDALDSERAQGHIELEPIPKVVEEPKPFKQVVSEYFGMYKKGFQFLSDNKYVFAMTFVKASGAAVWCGIDTIHIRIAETNFKIGHDSSLSLGIILASGGLGITLIPFLFARIVKDLPKNHNAILKFGFFLQFVCTYCLGFSSNSLPFYLIFNTLRSSSTCILWLYSSSILQQLLPNQVRGRVFSFEFGILTVFNITSKLMCGVMLDEFLMTPREIIFVYATVGILIFFAWLMVFDKYPREPIKEETIYQTQIK
ncbi:hypothetical protein DLAC_10260 [Tieghemostelium lacteum]|uniref:Major facilitator superfamily (MFS) profile domain-containing protein n=1 Tax=Tieghemostelium lacteum TaxID=361077 RepID=A0A151Z4Z7_TIELA|nr:hypothetical protein DLAC_10260 [Tieghemostelium lacteum]|eukprot:KYQ89036.1 hypothetical protein DLAC_10260 [Tieghemostelium lacteum]